MKITTERLKEIIQEELSKEILSEDMKIRKAYGEAVKQLVNTYKGDANLKDPAFIEYFNANFDKEDGLLYPTKMAVGRTSSVVTLGSDSAYGRYRLPDGKYALYALRMAGAK